MKKALLGLILVLAIVSGALAQSTPQPAKTAAPATATPSTGIVRFSGQLLDIQRGFVFFTTGDAFKLAPEARIIDLKTGTPTKTPTTRSYVRVTFDPVSKAIVEMAVSPRALANSGEYLSAAEVKQYAVVQSTPVANPELAPGARGGKVALTGKIIPVKFIVRVPPTTRLTDAVYMATDSSGWSATAFRMERVDGIHYALTMPLATGTKFAYRYTRGSWRSVERGRTGLEESPRQFFLDSAIGAEPDTKLRDDLVSNWSDENAGAPNAGPNTLPTPYNPRAVPFPTFSSIPQSSPSPRPT